MSGLVRVRVPHVPRFNTAPVRHRHIGP
jgi:hypothetical protein